MAYRIMGRVHALITPLRSGQSGQGTVEYVGLILLVAVVLAGVVAATKQTSIGGGQIGETIVRKLKSALDAVH